MASRLVAGLALVVLGLVAFLAEVLLRVVVVLRAGLFFVVGDLVVLFLVEEAGDFLAAVLLAVEALPEVVFRAEVLGFGGVGAGSTVRVVVLRDVLFFAVGDLVVLFLVEDAGDFLAAVLLAVEVLPEVVFRAAVLGLGGAAAGSTVLAVRLRVVEVAWAVVFFVVAALRADELVLRDDVVFLAVDVVFFAAAPAAADLVAALLRVVRFLGGGGGGGGGGAAAPASLSFTLGMIRASSLRTSPPFRPAICRPREARFPAGTSSSRSTFIAPRCMTTNNSCSSVTMAASATAP